MKAVIFDVDGVLLDSVPYHFKAWQRMFGEQGIEFTHRDYLEKVNGLPRIQGIKNMLPDRDAQELARLAEIKQGYLMEMIEQDPPKPLKGVTEFLGELKKRGYARAAASSSKNAPRLLSLAGIDSSFDTIVSGHDFTQPKPDPEIFLTAAARLDVTPEQSVVIEDAIFGVQAAKNGGMKAIGLLTSNDNSLQSVADIVIRSLEEYPRVLDFLDSY